MIEWNVDPTLFTLGPIAPRWYGLLFALAFIVSYQIMRRMFLDDSRNVKDLDALTIAIIVGTIAGARLGHVLFYDTAIFLDNPFEVFAVWHGGLASHGGAVGIVVGMWWFHRKHKQYSTIWLLDRLAIVAAISGMLIRIGNLFNSEIIGKPTDVAWAFWFQRVDPTPVWRHPTMLYEAFVCLDLFILTWLLYKRGFATKRPGFIFGTFITLLFIGRFLIEFLKENQEAFEASLPINMGQILSIPFIILGLWFLFRPGVRSFTDSRS